MLGETNKGFCLAVEENAAPMDTHVRVDDCVGLEHTLEVLLLPQLVT